ncbi:MAG: hypothetical protein VKO21_03725 [Candidatus Sericytochromatia bacterium]|nr:hypothetical protein [Candidatus Sericytochromatia bacterium]
MTGIVLLAALTGQPEIPGCTGVTVGGKGIARWARLSGPPATALDRFDACWRRAGWSAEEEPAILDGGDAPGRLRLWRRGPWRATIFEARDAGGRALCLVLMDRGSPGGAVRPAPGGP